MRRTPTTRDTITCRLVSSLVQWADSGLTATAVLSSGREITSASWETDDFGVLVGNAEGPGGMFLIDPAALVAVYCEGSQA
jgi:hypothetical protein